MRLAIGIRSTPMYCIVKPTWDIGQNVVFYNLSNKTISIRLQPYLCCFSVTQWGIIELMCNLTHWGRDKVAAIFQKTLSKCIFFSKNVLILLRISLRFVPNGPINNIPALFQIIAWRRPGDKPLSKPMVVGLLAHICDTRSQWVKAYFIASVTYDLITCRFQQRYMCLQWSWGFKIIQDISNTTCSHR